MELDLANMDSKHCRNILYQGKVKILDYNRINQYKKLNLVIALVLKQLNETIHFTKINKLRLRKKIKHKALNVKSQSTFCKHFPPNF